MNTRLQRRLRFALFQSGIAINRRRRAVLIEILAMAVPP